MSWTEERVETLKRMWSEGQSASQIAKELGGVTRNAVIGKVHRLGLSNRVAAPPAADPAPSPVETPTPAPDESVAALADAGADAVPEAEAGIAEVVEPEPVIVPEEAPPQPAEQAVEEEMAREPVSAPGSFARRGIVPAGQPLPPQPSANEVSAEALATVREVEKSARRLTLMELTERTCKWPVGDPATDDFWFCGLPVQPGKPYCEAHVAVAFQPMSSRRDRRR